MNVTVKLNFDIATRVIIYLRAGDIAGMKAYLAAADFTHFKFEFMANDYILERLIVQHFEFGCFRRYYDGSTSSFVDSWLYGRYHAHYNVYVTDSVVAERILKGLSVDWVDLSDFSLMHAATITVVSGVPLTAVQFKFYDLIGKRFVKHHQTATMGIFNLFQTGLTKHRPTWSKLEHPKTDWIFKEQALTLMLMSRFSAAQFSVSRDAVSVILGHLYNYHCDWLIEQTGRMNEYKSMLKDYLNRGMKSDVLAIAQHYSINLDCDSNYTINLGINHIAARRHGLVQEYEWFRGGGTIDDWIIEQLLPHPMVTLVLAHFGRPLSVKRADQLNLGHVLLQMYREDHPIRLLIRNVRQPDVTFLIHDDRFMRQAAKRWRR